MPAELFRPSAFSTSTGRRVSLLPLSVVAHVVAIAAVLIAPLLADVELPAPARTVPLAYVRVTLPAPPPAAPVAPRPRTTMPSRQAAPIDAPSTIPPDRTLDPTPMVEPGTGTGEHLFQIADAIDVGQPVSGYVPAPPPPPPPAPKGPVRIGGQIEAPTRIRDVRPAYPVIAQQARVQGSVMMDAIIGIDGRVREVRVTRSVPLLDEAAMAAVRQWVFTPTRLNGEAVPVVMTVTVEFRLN